MITKRTVGCTLSIGGVVFVVLGYVILTPSAASCSHKMIFIHVHKILCWVGLKSSFLMF